MSTDALSVGALAQRTAAIVRADPRFFAIMILLQAVPALWMEYAGWLTASRSGMLTALSIYIDLLVTFRTLRFFGGEGVSETLASEAGRRYLAALGLGLLSGAGIIGAALLFLLPGVLLAALWSLALPALVAERIGVIAALRRSRHLVDPRVGRFVLLLIVANALLVLVFLMGIAPRLWHIPDTRSPAMAGDLLSSIWTTITPVFWTVAYVACRAREDGAGDLTPPADPRHPRAYT